MPTYPWSSWQMVLRVLFLQSDPTLLLTKKKKRKRWPQSLYYPCFRGSGVSFLSKEMRAPLFSSPQIRRGVLISSISSEKALCPVLFIPQHTKKRPLVVEIHLLSKYLLNTLLGTKNKTDITPTHMVRKNQ